MTMKAKILLFAALMLTFTAVNAQRSRPFAKGDNIFNFGIGFGSLLHPGNFYKTTLTPVSISYEHVMQDGMIDGNAAWGIGGFFGYSSSKWEDSYWGGKYGWKYSYLVIGPRGTFHYYLAPNLDTYAAVFTGYNIVTANEFGNFPGVDKDNAVKSSFAFSFILGARYYLTNNFAAMTELGYGISIVNLGFALKF